jgi:hypothetical protein
LTRIRHVLPAGEGIHVNEREVEAGPECHMHEPKRDRLEAIAGADNPYSLITNFGRGHLASKQDVRCMLRGVRQ